MNLFIYFVRNPAQTWFKCAYKTFVKHPTCFWSFKSKIFIQNINVGPHSASGDPPFFMGPQGPIKVMTSGLEGKIISRKGFQFLQFVFSPPGTAKSHILDF